ncbi:MULTISPECIES: hypothetical protein [Pontibacillus]|uniref:Uncharacterized protein n=1 Tax=Pontibacillus chungwhensis TaxID=265426 RepID=A0ABY8UZH1_9BACI|nr:MULTISPECIES: hypothetical protein [Pontibacillus]MCD5325539.1 hypothetical protein [Pontibacillus sp. HN14]WIF98648.1 hypothetical protein QNI29_02980 [Pontibacillus chungwhensis]
METNDGKTESRESLIKVEQLQNDLETLFFELERETDSLDVLWSLSNKKKSILDMLRSASKEQKLSLQQISELETTLESLHQQLKKSEQASAYSNDIWNDLLNMKKELRNTENKIYAVHTSQNKIEGLLESLKSSQVNKEEIKAISDSLLQVNLRVNTIEDWMNTNAENMISSLKDIIVYEEKNSKKAEELQKSSTDLNQKIEELEFVDPEEMNHQIQELKNNIMEADDKQEKRTQEIRGIIQEFISKIDLPSLIFKSDLQELQNQYLQEIDKLQQQRVESELKHKSSLKEWVKEIKNEMSIEFKGYIKNLESQITSLEFVTKEDLYSHNPQSLQDLRNEINDLKDTQAKSVGGNQEVVAKVNDIVMQVEDLHSKVNTLDIDRSNVEILKKLIHDVNEFEEKIVKVVSGIKDEAKEVESPIVEVEAEEETRQKDVVEDKQQEKPKEANRSNSVVSADSWFYHSAKNAKETQQLKNPYSQPKTTRPSSNRSPKSPTSRQVRNAYPNKPTSYPSYQKPTKPEPPSPNQKQSLQRDAVQQPVKPSEQNEVKPPVKEAQAESKIKPSDQVAKQEESKGGHSENQGGSGSSFLNNVKKFFTE